MRILAALVLGYYMIVGRVGVELGGSGAELPVMPEGMIQAARGELDRALGAVMTGDTEFAQSERAFAGNGRVVFVPDCAAVEKSYDLVIHFHGAHSAMEPVFEKSRVDAVLTVLNLGAGSGKYEHAFRAPGTFKQLVERTAKTVERICPGTRGTVNRIALSGWSAGYGAVARILDRQSDAERVDAVLLADGLHADFEPEKARERVVNWPQLAPFTLFADRAVNGEKLMAITHSSISTPYASTTETAAFLLNQESVPKVTANTPGPRQNMTLLYRADRGSFHVQGYTGKDKAAHCDHLFALGDTLFPLLRERWSR